LIGINPGAGRVFANKAWRPEGYVELMGEVGGRVADARFLLLGGADEAGLIGRLRAAGGARALSVGTHHPLGVFAALIERCGVVVSGDTLAMHLAVGVGRRSVAIFGPTCPQEIDLFGLGEKIVTPIGCSPCYLHACDKSPTCQDMIPTRTVVEAVLRQIGTLAQEAPRVG
jgi:heptosyltransferase-2